MEMNKEDLLCKIETQLGGFGYYQKWILSLATSIFFLCGVAVVNHIFTGFNVQYRCKVPQCEDPVNATYAAEFLNFTTPSDESTTLMASSCYTFATTGNLSQNASCEPDLFDDSKTLPCDDWIYDTSLFKSTFMTDFGLTCDKAWLRSLGSSAYMFGMPFGAVIIGYFGDRFGRRTAILVGQAIVVCGEALASVSPNLYMYFAMRFLSGAGGIAAFQVSTIQVLEIVSPDRRAFCGMLSKIPFSFGETLVAFFAYGLRDWRWLQVTLAVPSIIVLGILWWLMPESIKWLVAKGKYKEVRSVVEKAARMNKVTLSEDILKTLSSDETGCSKTEETQNGHKKSPFDLFKSPRMRTRTMVLILTWIIITHDFYGLSFNSVNVGGNIFVNYIGATLIEIPSYVFGYLMLDRIGRKGTLLLLMTTGGLICFAACLFNQNLVHVFLIMNLIGKFCIAAAFTVVYIFTIELFPTPYRSLGLGICSMSARIGGVISPFTSSLAEINKTIPLVIIGLLALVSGISLLLLPETMGSKLPQTLEESENYGTDQPLLYLTCCKNRKRIQVKPCS